MESALSIETDLKWFKTDFVQGMLLDLNKSKKNWSDLRYFARTPKPFVILLPFYNKESLL